MVTINQNTCIGCGLCAADCIGKHIRIMDGKAQMSSECFKCGHCVAICPVGAVSIPEYDMADVEPSAKSMMLTPKELLNVIKSRRSVRKYKSEAVPQEALDMLAQAGRYTATAKNTQNCSFIFVQSELAELKERVWRYIEEQSASEDPGMGFYKSFNERRKADPADDYLFRDAPVVVYIATENPWDAGMAAQNIELMAVALGMGCLFNGFLARISDANPELKHWLGIEEKSIKACMLLGYPERKYARTAPRDAGHIIMK